MFLATFKTLHKQEIQQVFCDLHDHMGGFDERRSVRIQFASSIASKFRQLPVSDSSGLREGMAAV